MARVQNFFIGTLVVARKNSASKNSMDFHHYPTFSSYLPKTVDELRVAKKLETL